MAKVALTELYDLFCRHPRVTTDTRRLQSGDIYFALRGEKFDGNRFADQALAAGAAYVVVDDASVVRDERYLLVDDVLTTLQELGRHHRRRFTIPVIAITGSNGKTTTKELVAAVMGAQYPAHATAGNLNNHIGVPLTLLAMPIQTEVAIIEMGANHQGEIDALCRIAEPTHGIITNIGKAHLEGFGGLEGVKKGKSELYRYLAETNGVAFVNLDEPFMSELAAVVKRQITYKRSDKPDLRNAPMEVQLLATHPRITLAFLAETGQLVEVESRLSGYHNFNNILTAISVGKYFKVSAANIIKAVANYTPSNNRSQVMVRAGTTYHLDAYNANPTSMRASLDNFQQVEGERKIAILGDMLELGGESEAAHREIADYASHLALERLVLVGRLFEPVAHQLNILHFSDAESLRHWFWQQDWQKAHILIKGSRGMQLERLMENGETH